VVAKAKMISASATTDIAGIAKLPFLRRRES
jgi:hypothetical protein